MGLIFPKRQNMACHHLKVLQKVSDATKTKGKIVGQKDLIIKNLDLKKILF